MRTPKTAKINPAQLHVVMDHCLWSEIPRKDIDLVEQLAHQCKIPLNQMVLHLLRIGLDEVGRHSRPALSPEEIAAAWSAK